MHLPKHMPALDGMRGIAILMVILTHVGNGWFSALMILQDTQHIGPTYHLPHWLVLIAADATHGVQLFFVVSAFTLTIRAMRAQDGLGGYALRRIARIGPAYWLAGIIYVLIGGLGPRLLAPNGISPVDMAIAAVFGSAWQGGPSLAIVPGGWSVSVELAFYIALPVILLVANGRIWRTLVLLCIALAVAQMRARHEMLAHDWDFLAFCHPFEQMPVFLCGVLAALCATRYRMPRIPGGALLLLAIGIVVLPLQHVPDWIFLNHLAFAFLAAASVVLAASHPPIILASRLLRRIGEVSYSMYLIHFGLLGISLRMAEWVVPALDWRTASLQFAITTTATFGLANITYKVIELPAIHWATKYKTRRPSPAMASPVA